LSDHYFISSDVVILLYEALPESSIDAGQGEKIRKGFQALVALVAKKLSQTVLLQLCWIFFFHSLFACFLEEL